MLDALVTVLSGLYAHLPAKRAAYATDPVQALVLLRRRAADLTDAEFHLAVTGIVLGLRDAHTRYRGPAVLRGHVAVLPFVVEAYGPWADPTFVVTKVDPDAGADGLPDGFEEGVEVVTWNAVPVARAVEVHADRETGGRADARRARALESLTSRPLDFAPPPDELWVDLGYRPRRTGRRGGSTEVREARFDWRVLAPGRAGTAVSARTREALKLAVDPAADAVRRAKRDRYAARRAWLDTSLPDVLAARPLDDRYGYLRLWSFDVADDDAYLDEVTRLLGLLPPCGVVVDLRANPGGLVWAAERLLQLFADPGRTGGPVQPVRFELAATPLTRQMALSPFNRLELEAWSASLQDSVTTGDPYSRPLPLTDPAWCGDRGRAYPGPAVAVVDATTYSSGDLFAAGWVDNRVGPLVTVGQASGGGGANVWTDTQVRDALVGTGVTLPDLPAGIGFTVAVRRAVRSGASDGVPLEDLGVAGIPYDLTRADLLDGNRDLLTFCTGLLDAAGTPPEILPADRGGTS
ncbi:S41 family peptidase [Luteimicrobium subarcticum]|uniref:S41 family peptidase n=1 Tax=Luteimicrobium subarcticum TaxID=620910 RepID=UPI001B7FF42D|nr:S41 family peptidase [Luteimicrobium subarcticum]